MTALSTVCPAKSPNSSPSPDSVTGATIVLLLSEKSAVT